MITQRTYSGLRIDLERPAVEMITLVDIVQGLSHCCRFSGQLNDFYSVAQHAVLVSLLVDPSCQIAALHHDDTEAYLGDLTRHLKHHPKLDGYVDIERNLNRIIEIKFGIDTTAAQHDHIKVADDLAAIFEQEVLREKRAWNAVEAVNRAVSEGFVSRTVESLLALAPRLPEFWRPLHPRGARILYYNRHDTI